MRLTWVLFFSVLSFSTQISTSRAGPLQDAARDGDLAGIAAALDAGADIEETVSAGTASPAARNRSSRIAAASPAPIPAAVITASCPSSTGSADAALTGLASAAAPPDMVTAATASWAVMACTAPTASASWMPVARIAETDRDVQGCWRTTKEQAS